MEQLTKRENQVLNGVRAGMMNKEVARALGIAPSTVSMHLQRAARKLGANGRIGAVLATLPQPGPLLHTTYERRLLAYVIHGEARGEPIAGMLAVGWSAINRLHRRSWYGATLAEVLEKPYQYSCLNAGIPQPLGLIANATIVAVADLLLAGLTLDPTGGATHYFNPDAVAREPDWFAGALGVVEIGHHLFCQPVAG